MDEANPMVRWKPNIDIYAYQKNLLSSIAETRRGLPENAAGTRSRQQNFHRFLQLLQVTKVVIGSSADRVCFWV